MANERSASRTLQDVKGGDEGFYLNLVGWRTTAGRGEGVEKEVGLITVPSAFALRRIRQPYLPAIL